MTVALVGGLDRLERIYETVGKKQGMRLKVFSRRVPQLTRRLMGVDGIVVFTGTVAHPLVREVMTLAKRQGIPVGLSHSSGISGLDRSLKALKPHMV